MRRIGVTFLASALAACSSGPDFCTRLAPVLQKQEKQIAACPVSDGGTPAVLALAVIGAEFPFPLQSCEGEITACNSNDQADLNRELACIQALPDFDCSVLDEVSDAGLQDFANSVSVCEPQSLSLNCRGGTDGGPGCGVEQHPN